MIGAKPIVYIVENIIDGKMYIGVTKRGLNRRKSVHFYKAKNNIGNSKFLAAIRAHGPESFSWRIWGQYESYQDALKAEIALIAEKRPEYNLTSGGEGTALPWPEERRAAKREHCRVHGGFFKGRKHTENARQLMSEAASQRPGTWRGKKRGDAYAALMSSIKRGKPNPKRGKPVVCLTDGAIFDTANDAARFYQIRQGGVTRVVRGERKSYAGRDFCLLERVA